MSNMDMLTISEAAQRLRVSRGFVYKLLQQGELPHFRVGKVIRIPAREFEEWCRSRLRTDRVGPDRTAGRQVVG